MSAFLGFLKHALIREVYIYESYIASRAHMLTYFTQSTRFCVHKHTHKHPDRHTNHSSAPAEKILTAKSTAQKDTIQ